MSEGSPTLFKALRPKGHAWRHGRQWKVWFGLGEWFVFDLGLGQFWLYCGRLSVSANRNAGWADTPKRAELHISWRRERRAR